MSCIRVSTDAGGEIVLFIEDRDGDQSLSLLTPSEARFYAGELLRAAIVAEDLTKKAAEKLHAEMVRDARVRAGGAT